MLSAPPDTATARLGLRFERAQPVHRRREQIVAACPESIALGTDCPGWPTRTVFDPGATCADRMASDRAMAPGPCAVAAIPALTSGRRCGNSRRHAGQHVAGGFLLVDRGQRCGEAEPGVLGVSALARAVVGIVVGDRRLRILPLTRPVPGPAETARHRRAARCGWPAPRARRPPRPHSRDGRGRRCPPARPFRACADPAARAGRGTRGRNWWRPAGGGARRCPAVGGGSDGQTARPDAPPCGLIWNARSSIRLPRSSFCRWSWFWVSSIRPAQLANLFLQRVDAGQQLREQVVPAG